MKWFSLVLVLLPATILFLLHPAAGSEPELFVNHDGTFETAYCWDWVDPRGIQTPYYGAYAESFDLGPGQVHAIDFWVTSVGYFPSMPPDYYVWRGGISTPPDEVIDVIFQGHLCGVLFWPDFGECVVEIEASVDGEFTVGLWNVDYDCGALLGADVNGPGGHPWTCVAPGLQWPSGWQDPSIVFGPTKSMALGVYFTPRDAASVEDEQPQEQESPTWGAIKNLFRR